MVKIRIKFLRFTLEFKESTRQTKSAVILGYEKFSFSMLNQQSSWSIRNFFILCLVRKKYKKFFQWKFFLFFLWVWCWKAHQIALTSTTSDFDQCCIQISKQSLIVADIHKFVLVTLFIVAVVFLFMVLFMTVLQLVLFLRPYYISVSLSVWVVLLFKSRYSKVLQRMAFSKNTEVFMKSKCH